MSDATKTSATYLSCTFERMKRKFLGTNGILRRHIGRHQCNNRRFCLNDNLFIQQGGLSQNIFLQHVYQPI